ncbi:MAG: hypothetical protein EOO25_01165 [Comamonadaceae bacterium]|nr:MAG: hypothetical protein EOO25_01165 [Comamonadaceae bacterium]
MNRIRTSARLSAFAAISLIAFVTLSPIGLRPVVTGIHTEHLFAFAIVGVLFGVGYPRHLLIAATLVIASAAGLEALQNLAPGAFSVAHREHLFVIVTLARLLSKRAGHCGGLRAWACNCGEC